MKEPSKHKYLLISHITLWLALCAFVGIHLNERHHYYSDNGIQASKDFCDCMSKHGALGDRWQNVRLRCHEWLMIEYYYYRINFIEMEIEKDWHFSKKEWAGYEKFWNGYYKYSNDFCIYTSRPPDSISVKNK